MAKPWNIVDLDPSQSLKVCLRRITETRIQEIVSYEHETLKGEDIEALHDMRVSARRLRAVLQIFRDCFPKKRFKKQDKKLQSLVRYLGAVREQDVFIEMLVSYRARLGAREGQIIELLIAREQASRVTQRKQLSRELRRLRREDFSASFTAFLKESL